MRDIGLDVHRDFCEVAITEAGELRSPGRIGATREALQLFAQSLGRDDRVALEVSGNAWEVARIIEPHVAKVLVVSPTDTGIRQARAKTDRLDARTLAKLLAAGSLEGLWMPDALTRPLRRAIQRYIEDPLADEVLKQGEMVSGSTVMVDRDQFGDEDEHPLKLTIIPLTTPPKPKADDVEPEKVAVGADKGEGEGSDEAPEEPSGDGESGE